MATLVFTKDEDKKDGRHTLESKLKLIFLTNRTSIDMAYNEKLSDRIREALSNVPKVEEKYMFGGVCYMVNGKMCIGVAKDEMMCRIGTESYESALEKPGCRPMDFTGKPMKGYVFVNEEGLKTKRQFDFWINLCLQFNSEVPQKKPVKRKR